jgi:hypothetical protein
VTVFDKRSAPTGVTVDVTTSNVETGVWAAAGDAASANAAAAAPNTK